PTQTQLQQAIQPLNQPKQPFNPNHNLQPPKHPPKQLITNPNHLNQTQKDPLKQQLHPPQTLPNLNTINQTPQDLNQPITQFKQPIPHKHQTKPNPNFLNPHTHNQNPYNNPIPHPQQIITPT
ncbi:GA module-containing protein, partial [Staphylococcus aureus]|uniref:GA module-containing protein n=1 Tax=Staphylococcus aureus TaxID=1280 RepID=UPI00119CACA0